MTTPDTSQTFPFPEEMASKHDLLFAVFTNLAAPGLDDMKPHLPEHLRYIERLRSEGILFAAGPFLTPSGENSGNGTYILRTSSLAKAHELATGDPLHRLGIRHFTIQPWAKEKDPQQHP